jgi:hypothetical protein
VKNLVGHGIATWLVSKYHVKVVIPFLMLCFDWLNLIANAYVVTSLDVVGLDDLEKGMFGVLVTLEKSSQGALVTKELFLFLKLCIPPSTCANLLCHDPNFGLATKARAWKGASRECNPGITFILLGM